MSTTLLIVLGVIAALIVLVLILGMTGARTFTLTRSRHMAAPPERVFPLIEDFHNWTQWSPFEEGDPTLERTYGGSAKGQGATYAWNGKKTGQGRMEIVKAVEPGAVTIDLQFIKPMNARNLVQFTIVPAPGGSTTTWTMSGAKPFMNRVVTKFMSMDRLVGGMFDKGLTAMKQRAEA